MKEIQLTQGQVALIDDEDFELVSQYKWYAQYYSHRDVYAGRSRAGMRGKMILLHNFIVRPDEGYTVDHINRNPLDNRRCNLRLANSTQQVLNQGLKSNAKVPYKGVAMVRSGKYVACVGAFGDVNHIGTFDSPTDAALAYDRAVLEYWSQVPDDPVSGNYTQFLYLNFPEG